MTDGMADFGITCYRCGKQLWVKCHSTREGQTKAKQQGWQSLSVRLMGAYRCPDCAAASQQNRRLPRRTR